MAAGFFLEKPRMNMHSAPHVKPSSAASSLGSPSGSSSSCGAMVLPSARDTDLDSADGGAATSLASAAECCRARELSADVGLWVAAVWSCSSHFAPMPVPAPCTGEEAAEHGRLATTNVGRRSGGRSGDDRATTSVSTDGAESGESSSATMPRRLLRHLLFSPRAFVRAWRRWSLGARGLGLSRVAGKERARPWRSSRRRGRGTVPTGDESDLTNGYLDTAIDWIPGMPGIRLKDIPSFIRTTDRDDVMLNFDGGEAQNARKARGVILNTYDALEQDVVDALRREFPRVYTVGPLATFANAAGGGGLDEIGGNLWKEDTGCLRWLETQRPGSVVYVNFGSITVMTAAQLAELAWGLAGCGSLFLWVIRPDLVSGENAMLPEGFVTDTKERGILASWCSRTRPSVCF
ncbi:unnamed protein product [Miscanthus lutarioriparius]|uniref:Uncharacterized protein n=1 Tax=Miscanthus lutarioriparius TaxID=422564 RepID=A0A811PSZ4_9POAL|nr:unnamed protein product [Miscanthus lutarioriparius]